MLYLIQTAFVIIQMVSPTILRIQQTVRNTFADKIAALGNLKPIWKFKMICKENYSFIFSGGTLGLFTGMSLQTFVEFAYWMFVLIRRTIRRFLQRD